MTSKEFSLLKKEALLEGAKSCQANAKAHFLCSQNISVTGNYGIANSLLILSVEESVKSLILLAGFFGINLPFDVRPFFSNHKEKHKQAAEIQPVINSLYLIKEMLYDILRNRKSNFSFAINLGLTFVFAAIDAKNKPKEQFDTWWKKANNEKNNGFYVDFRNNSWCLPTSITEETYKETLKMAKPFIESLDLIKELKNDDYKLLTST